MVNHHKHKTHTNNHNNNTPLDNIEIPDTRYMSNKVMFINFALLPLFLAASFFICKFIYNEDYKKVDHPVIENLTTKIFSQTKFNSFESKLSFVLLSVALASIFNLALTILTVLARVITNASSAMADKEPLLVNTLNRIIQNNIEQGLVFFPLLAHFVFNINVKNNTENNSLAAKYVIMFFVGRIVFIIGYLFSLLTKIIGLRVTGFGINMIVGFLLVIKYLGIKDLEFKVNAFLA